MADTVIRHTRETDPAATLAHYLQDEKKIIRFRVYPKMLVNRDITELELTQRACNCLKRSGYETVEQLAEGIMGISDLLKIRGTGKKTAEEIMYKLFIFQYSVMDSERKPKYLQDVIRLNRIGNI